ncbi:MAG: DUF885 domain-containing protein [Myxococcales bacterium]|nr:DUF885 domain-containing protein [Myxococcales bacterium]
MLTFIMLSCAKPVPVEAPAPAPDVHQELMAFFDQVHAEELAANPISAAYLGVEHDDTQWTDISEAHELQQVRLAQEHLDALRDRFGSRELDEQDALSVRMFEARQQRRIEGARWFLHGYRVHQMYGTHTFVPSFLTTVHRIEDEADARSWIARVDGVPGLFAQLGEILAVQEDKGILPPAFVYPHVLKSIDNLLTGAPFSDGEPSPLWAHFDEQVQELSLSDEVQQELRAEAKRALTESLQPAYRSLYEVLSSHVPTEDDGVWKLPEGAGYYAHRLRRMTTTDMAPDAIHELGLAEVARIHEEMRQLMPALGVQGDLKALFDHLRSSPDYVLPNTDAGREAYLELARGYVTAMEARLPEVFDILPKAPMEVRRVEPWREGSAGKAFYQSASPDGARPGIFYANLADMTQMPTYQLEALVYHEGVPGHHMQNAVSQELDELPPFRRFGGFGAYGEGWGLYSEFLPKEMGFYEDPASDAGRLAMELWRAARLVVDTGIHHKRWTRRQAIDYLMENTPNPEGDAERAIERYIVMPGQATVYKIGMLRIVELREAARATLGEDFDLTGFHRAVLGHGPVPLDVLGERVEAWVSASR